MMKETIPGARERAAAVPTINLKGVGRNVCGDGVVVNDIIAGTVEISETYKSGNDKDEVVYRGHRKL